MKSPQPGPVYLDDNIPYDYIVIIDSGSSGSRVYVYNWLNPLAVLNKSGDFTEMPKPEVRLVHREEVAAEQDGPLASEELKQAAEGKAGSSEDLEASPQLESEEPDKTTRKLRVPKVQTGHKWNKKIKPGLSTFSSSPQKVGKHHLWYLLQLASYVVPKSQHHRTPIFLHSTAGMRLLDLKDQRVILDTICDYLTRNSDFYLPECPNHVNVIDGDVEGLYGWLAVNYLQGSMDHPEEHQHGKGHTTYGLLDMGGASTQVVFQPNSTEIEEHKNNLFRINLYELPAKKDNSYLEPAPLEYSVYSDSFLGFGMYQAHTRYLKMLTDAFAKEHNVEPKFLSMPVPDPCVPKGYTYSATLSEGSFDLIGSSDFQGCLKAIFSVISDKDYTPKVGNGNCEQLSESSMVSSCLLNDLIPAFDFDVNHFVGVSGYWDAINSLYSYEKEKRLGLKYDYKRIYKQTSTLCSLTFADLKLISKTKGKGQLEESDLANLCFKSSWILNFLHQSLGFPRFGIDSEPKKPDRFQSLQLVDKVGGLPFSWTLGRAILYANDEYVQAYNNFTIARLEAEEKSQDTQTALLKRPGFYHSVSPNAYNYGGEQKGVIPRLQFQEPDPTAKYHHYDYETSLNAGIGELKWHVQPHRWYGAFIFMSLILFIIWLMMGRTGRSDLKQKVSKKIKGLAFWRKRDDGSYSRVNQEEVAGFELRDLEDEV